MTDFDAILRDPISRRAFLTRMTAAGLGTAAAAFLAGCGGTSGDGNNGNNGGTTTGTTSGTGGGLTFFDQTNFPGIPGTSETQVVLNFALTLETIEADLYRQMIYQASGKTVAAAQDINQSPFLSDYSKLTLGVSDGGLGSLAPIGFLYLQQYAPVEAAHRDFLRTVLGSAAVGANPKGYQTTLKDGANLKDILTLLQVVEETGVTAYLGAAGFITELANIQVAAAIYSTEARHSAGISYVLNPTASTGPTGQYAGGTQPATGPQIADFEFANTPKTVLNAVQPFIVK